MDTSCLKQSNKLKYVANVFGRAVSKKYRQYHYYDTPKYVVQVLGGVVSKIHRRLPESRNRRHFQRFDSMVSDVPDKHTRTEKARSLLAKTDKLNAIQSRCQHTARRDHNLKISSRKTTVNSYVYASHHLCMYVCIVTHAARVWTNRVRLPILLVAN